jgi:hypothetical protein
MDVYRHFQHFINYSVSLTFIGGVNRNLPEVSDKLYNIAAMDN